MPQVKGVIQVFLQLRLQPGQEQQGLFNLDDIRCEEVKLIINREVYREWQSNEDQIEHNMRAWLLRYVTGDDTVDESFEQTLSRMGI